MIELLVLILCGTFMVALAPEHSRAAELGAFFILFGILIAPVLWLAGLA